MIDLHLDDIQAKAAQSLYVVIDALAFSRDPLPAEEIYYLLHRHRVRLVGAAQQIAHNIEQLQLLG